MMNNGLQGRKDREFILNINHNLTLNNSTLFGTFNGDAQVWFVGLQAFDWKFPIGTRFKIKRMIWNLTLSGLGGTSVVLEIMNNLLSLTSLSKTSTGFSDSGNIDIDYIQTLLTDKLFPRMYKFIPVGGGGNMTGTAQLYCEWLVHPTEVT